MNRPAPLSQLKPLVHRLAVPAQLALAVLVLVLAGMSLRHMAMRLDLHAVLRDARALPVWRLAAALGFTAASYLLLTIYDVMALRAIGKPLPWRAAALASFTSYTLSHNLGFGIITGAAARLRVYGARGLSTGDVARVTAIAGVTFWSGVLASAALALLVHRQPLTVPGHVLSLAMQHAAGAGLLVLLVLAALLGKRWHLPGPGGMARMTAAALADISAACAALLSLIHI